MKLPWVGKTGAAKAVAAFATLLLVSVGLCGVNWVVALKVPSSDYLGGLLVAGWLELAGILVGFVGLVISLIVAARSGSEEN